MVIKVVRRRDLRRRLFGGDMATWGPLPDGSHLVWAGPGDYLARFTTDPFSPHCEPHGEPIGTGEYANLAAAQRAVDALAAAYQAEGQSDREEQ